MRQRLKHWVQAKGIPDAAPTSYWIGAFYVVWIGAVWYFDWGVTLW